MSTLTPERLAELTAQALERTAFMMADQTEPNDSALGSATRCARIRYAGPSSGTVVLRTGDEFLRALASNLLGVEPEAIDMATCGEDAMKELTNIVGGSVVLELGGRDCTYSLGLPSLSACPTGTPEAAQTCCLDCEGQLLFVTWEPDATPSSLAA